MFGSGAQTFTAQFPLLPFEILTDAVGDVVEELSLFPKEWAFPRRRLFLLVVNFDRSNRSTPDGDRRTQPPWSIYEVRQRMRAPEVFNAGRRVLRVLPSWRECIQYPTENYLRGFFTTGKGSRYAVDAPQFLGPLPQRPEFMSAVLGFVCHRARDRNSAIIGHNIVYAALWAATGSANWVGTSDRAPHFPTEKHEGYPDVLFLLAHRAPLFFETELSHPVLNVGNVQVLRLSADDAGGVLHLTLRAAHPCPSQLGN